MQRGNTCSKVYIVSLIELLFCSMISKCFSQMPLYIHDLNRMSRIIYLIYKSSFNEIMMEFENMRQISKDNTHRTLLVGLIFGIQMQQWNTGSKVHIVSLIELLFCSMISKCFSQMPLYIQNFYQNIWNYIMPSKSFLFFWNCTYQEWINFLLGESSF